MTDENTSPAGLKGGQGRSGQELEEQVGGWCKIGCLTVVLLAVLLTVILIGGAG